MTDLPKAYNPAASEEKWYPFWEKNGFFNADVNPQKKPFTIVIPPPNITGILTMGHVLNNTIQDMFIRLKRMQGYETLWLPGTDHAGIATQNVVERSLVKEGKTRHDIGREEFVRLVWKWKEEYGSIIIKQLKKLGTSCDWRRTRFTMDEGLSEAVQEIFVRFYNKGLIYRGKYIVNWCPKDHTAISDDEVKFTEQNDHLWYIKYPFVDSEDFAVVATTRPETMLGDTAVAVNPKDERFKRFIGKYVRLPLTDRKIPVIADEAVDVNFGTGMVKVTPAHDSNDYWICQRYNEKAGDNSPMMPINIFDLSAKTNANVPQKYQNLDRFEARKVIVKDLENQGLLLKIEQYTHNVSRCYRCETIIEPYLSDQWFVKMKPLTEKALQVVLDGTIRFHPERWIKTYEHWMLNIRDWCISRQLWWGHRIPVWYCEDKKKEKCSEPIVVKGRPEKCPHCGSTNLRQDEDVLDTWFSSWLWPFSTLGWPTDNPDLRYFYPTNILVTGPDIIFFWVARMIMAGLTVMKDIPRYDDKPRSKNEDIVPFKDVYFTSIIRDIKGRKMSKSLGNSPDPLEVIKEYGADALRFTILYLAPHGQDVLYSNEKCEIGRNFANKVWNAGRFLLINKKQLSNTDYFKNLNSYNSSSNIPEEYLDLADRWILSRLNSSLHDFISALDKFEINQATKILYDFIWHDFCDWYIEMIKTRLYGNESDEIKALVLHRAIIIYEHLLKMLHPFMPFVTEELWQHIAHRKTNESIMISKFPEINPKWIDKAVENEMDFVQNTINSIRNIRGELSIPPSKDIEVVLNLKNKEKELILKKYKNYFHQLARVVNMPAMEGKNKPKHSASAVIKEGEVFIPLEGVIDINDERARLQKEIAHASAMIESITKKLSNDNFRQKAPQEIVEKEQEKLENFRTKLKHLQKYIDDLKD